MTTTRPGLLGAMWCALLLLVIASLATTVAAQDERHAPRLVLQITVDQLRGDLPTRYFERLGPGGFRYLWKQGVVFSNAHHAHANTETIVGHTTLATGAHPATHGMIGNLWLDRKSGEQTYDIEDARYPLLVKGVGVDASVEIDPRQKAARSQGRSPSAILVSTTSDELASHTGGRAKVFAVSAKDRGAVSMAGHAGKAFWFSKARGEFVTSSYYYDQLPEWVVEWNDGGDGDDGDEADKGGESDEEDEEENGKPARRYHEKSWELLHPRSSYLFGESDDRPWEVDLAGFGKTFPHPYGSADGNYYTTLLTISPAADELTLDFAEAVMEHEDIGQDAVTDYLGISFSSTDYIGHFFGLSSLEAEDNILRLDRLLARLFATIDERVGLERTLIVLSADHGGPDTPGYLNELGIPAGYLDPDSWDSEGAITRLKEAFGIEGPLLEKFVHPYIYLSENALNTEGVDRQALERAVAREVTRFPGISQAISSTALRFDDLPDTPIVRAVRNSYHPSRSGDVYVVSEPNWFIHDFDGLLVASAHGSPWRYDTYVPIVFAGAGITPRRVYRRVETVAVASTIALFVGTKFPSGAEAEPLVEVLER